MRIESTTDVAGALARGIEENGLLVAEGDLAPGFFDLRTGLAGELFQTFVKYRVPLALVVHDPAAHGERFAELAREHRGHPMVRIFSDEPSARAWLRATADANVAR